MTTSKVNEVREDNKLHGHLQEDVALRKITIKKTEIALYSFMVYILIRDLMEQTTNGPGMRQHCSSITFIWKLLPGKKNIWTKRSQPDLGLPDTQFKQLTTKSCTGTNVAPNSAKVHTNVGLFSSSSLISLQLIV